MTIFTTHANVDQVQNTQTLNGRQEVEYFCQILFRLATEVSPAVPPSLPRVTRLPVHHRGFFRTDFSLPGLPLIYAVYASSLQKGFSISSTISTKQFHQLYSDCPYRELTAPKVEIDSDALIYFTLTLTLMPEITFINPPLTSR